MEELYRKGDRFEDLDRRAPGRIIEIVDVWPFANQQYSVVTEVNPNNPSSIGRRYPTSHATLSNRKRFRKVSR